MRAEFAKLIKGGATITSACGVLGIGRTTFRRWLEVHPDLCAALEKAQNERFLAWEKTVHSGAKKDPSIALRALRATRPKDWAQDRAVSATVDHRHVHLTLNSGEIAGLRDNSDDSDVIDMPEDDA